MNVQTNISEILRVNVEGLNKLAHPDEMLRAVAFAVLPAIRKRVHVDGLATDGALIGTYSPEYMKVRTGNYRNSTKVKKGKNKGTLKDAGLYSKGINKGKSRLRYNRSADTKVILSLTRQMENDLSVVPSPSGYGIGFKNPFNFDKSQWLEQQYKRRIWGLTQEENTLAFAVANDFVQKSFNQ